MFLCGQLRPTCTQVDVHVDSFAKTAPEEGKLVKIAPLPEKPPTMEENAADDMSCIQDSFEAKGILEEARRIMLQSRTESTRKVWHQSQTVEKIWIKINIDSHDISVNNVLRLHYIIVTLTSLVCIYHGFKISHDPLSRLLRRIRKFNNTYMEVKV